MKVSRLLIVFAVASFLLTGCHGSKLRTPQPAKNTNGTDSAASLAWVLGGSEDEWPIEAVFEDVVTHSAYKAQGEAVFLNFGGKFPDCTLTVWWPKSYVKKTQLAWLTDINGKRVRVTGRPSRYKGKPEVVIKGLEQIQLLNQ